MILEKYRVFRDDEPELLAYCTLHDDPTCLGKSTIQLDCNTSLFYALESTGSGLYIFINKGHVHIEGHSLKQNEVLEIFNVKAIQLVALEKSELVLIDMVQD